MTELDPRGLEKAAKALCVAYSDTAYAWEDYLPEAQAVVLSYLDATQPEGEPDRIAVVVSSDDKPQFEALVIDPGTTMNEHGWKWMEYGMSGPYARALVECSLPRPAEPVTVQGRVR